MSYLDLSKAHRYTNGKHKQHVHEEQDDGDEELCNSFSEHVKSLWRRPTLNEWSVTLIMLLFSSSIVLGKLYFYHDFLNFLDLSTSKFTFYEYSWFIKAVSSGLAATGMCWFILYHDSNEPGVNPPTPFSPKKRIYSESPGLELNYLVGGLLGILVFLFMCL